MLKDKSWSELGACLAVCLLIMLCLFSVGSAIADFVIVSDHTRGQQIKIADTDIWVSPGTKVLYKLKDSCVKEHEAILLGVVASNAALKYRFLADKKIFLIKYGDLRYLKVAELKKEVIENVCKH